MNGAHEWFAYLGSEEVYLGRHQVPNPLQEGDRWSNGNGVSFEVVGGEITIRRDEPDTGELWQ
jgi:hypothetical protein